MVVVLVVEWLLLSVLNIDTINGEYYSLDGSGNNLDHPAWGVADQVFQRSNEEIEYLSYADGQGEIDSSLPNPRKISNMLGQVPISQSKYSNYAPLSGIAWYGTKLYPIRIIYIKLYILRNVQINKNITKT